jgi:hypothetical protein
VHCYDERGVPESVEVREQVNGQDQLVSRLVLLNVDGITRGRLWFRGGKLDATEILDYFQGGGELGWPYREIDSFGGDGALKYNCVYVVDRKGRCVEHTRRSTQGSVLDRYVYAYDDEGNVVSETCFKAKPFPVKKKSSRSQGTNREECVETFDETDGSAESMTITTYDANGDVVAQRTIQRGTLVAKSVFERSSLDPRGNWRDETHALESVDEWGALQPPRVLSRVRRDISYYPE